MAGRPTKFNAAITAKIAFWYSKGKTDAQVAELVNISERTLNYWKADKPQFLQTVQESKSIPDDLVEASLFSRATGYRHADEKIFYNKDTGEIIRAPTVKHYPPDTTAGIFWLKNRRPDVWRTGVESPLPPTGQDRTEKTGVKTFSEFATSAFYPAPYPKQIEMYAFGMDQTVARLILGARGYGKTDYVVILGIAYKIYLNPDFRALIITKSKERNGAMLAEIAAALKANGVVLEKENVTCIRVAGLHGKDHSVSAVTIKTVTLRGRHPDLVVMDDPVTEDDTSDATRLLVEKKYNEISKLTANVLIIGQPAHKYDLYAKLRDLVKTLEVPHGTIPELDHDLEAQRAAGVDDASIQASYFLKVVSQSDAPFDRVKYVDRWPVGDSAVAFIDPSFEGGDYTALTILKAYLGGVAIVGFTYKRAWDHCLDEVGKNLVKYGVKRLCFETNSLGSMPLQILRAHFKDVGVTGRKSNGHKHSRIMNAGTFAESIHLCRESDKIYLDQTVKYEYKAKNDDAPDSLASCLEWVGLIRGKD